ncbi:MAG: UvrD-helicase domain-containing protein [Alphaproteobacteria bacterium]
MEVLRQAYAQYKQEKGLLDFDDCLDVANRLLNEPEVVEYCHNQYRYIMVDEYQDTNLVQAELIKKLVGSNGNIMVVGDPSQSIYAFRGAVAKNIFDFYHLLE